MKIAPSRKYMMSLESVAMTDIVLNMFIFFFISFSLLYTFSPAKTKQIKVNLPRAKNVTSARAKLQTAHVVLSSDGPVYLEGGIITLKELENQLSAMHKRDPSLAVVLQVDRLVAFKNVVRVLDVINGLNIDSLHIAAEQEK